MTLSTLARAHADIHRGETFALVTLDVNGRQKTFADPDATGTDEAILWRLMLKGITQAETGRRLACVLGRDWPVWVNACREWRGGVG